MENKKYLPLKLIHVALMAIALMISVISMVKVLQTNTNESDSLYYFLVNITKILALLSGIYYIVNGYKKADANYYKMFVFFLLAYEIVFDANNMLVGSDLLRAYSMLISLVLIAVLAVGKNLGKRNTFIYAGVVFVCKVINCVTDIKSYLAVSSIDLMSLSYLLSNIILALTIIFMAVGKYIDKAQRKGN